MRVWRQGALIQRMCIAKITQLYFTEEEARQFCGLQVTTLPKFWMWSKSGNLDAQICSNHAAIVANGRGYLSEQIRASRLLGGESK